MGADWLGYWPHWFRSARPRDRPCYANIIKNSNGWMCWACYRLKAHEYTASGWEGKKRRKRMGILLLKMGVEKGLMYLRMQVHTPNDKLSCVETCQTLLSGWEDAPLSTRQQHSLYLWAMFKLNASSNWRGRGCEYIGRSNTMHTCL